MDRKKIIIIGCPGSGKSTFARRLHDVTGLPTYHLDTLFRKYPEKEVITFYNRDEAMKWLVSEYMIVPVAEDNIIEA